MRRQPQSKLAWNDQVMTHVRVAYALDIAKRRSQQGAALILIMFMLGMGLIAFMLKTVGTSTLEFQQKDRTTLALEGAKEALIAWAVSQSDYPGQLPWPDRNGDGNYDGGSDCATTSFSTAMFIGQLPISTSTNPCINYPGLGSDFLDGAGNRLWYAVSRNLVRNYQSSTNPVINPGIIDSPTYSWMRVLDRNGNLISDRVAAVIIAAGPPLANQDRSGVPDATEYLDSLQIGATVYSNQDDDSDNEDFIMAPESAHLPSSDTTYQAPYYFNDRLVYITIDELMAALEKRVAAEVKTALVSYKSSYGAYPYAAPLGVTLNYSCKDGVTAGFLPVDAPVAFSSTVSCSSNTNCSGMSFVNDISSVSYTNPFINWSGTTGACTRSGRTCTCTGTGSCTIFGVIDYSCNQPTGICQSSFVMTGTSVVTPRKTDVISSSGAAGACSSQVLVNGSGTFTGAICSDPGISPKVTASTTVNNDELSGTGFVSQNIQPGMYVSGTGIAADTIVESVTDSIIYMSKDATATGTASIRISRLRDWFFDNGWQNYIYYAMSKTSGALTVGTRTNVDALLVTTGKAIASTPYVDSKGSVQSRSLSCSNADYLDSTENADADTVYDVTSKPRKANYNDQMFIVSP